MRVEPTSYAMSPERITTDMFDCIWVIMQPDRIGRPSQNLCLQWIDWKLLGRISRYLVSNPNIGASNIYFPSCGLIASPLVGVVNTNHLSWKVLLAASDAIRAGKIAILCESARNPSSVKQAISGFSGLAHTKEVTLVLDPSTA